MVSLKKKIFGLENFLKKVLCTRFYPGLEYHKSVSAAAVIDLFIWSRCEKENYES